MWDTLPKLAHPDHHAFRPIPWAARPDRKRGPSRYTFSAEAMSNLTPSDQALFERFGQGPLVRPAFDAIHHAFESYASAQPDAPAVEHRGATISYGELNRHADRLAARLTTLGVGPGDNVALFLRRSIPMVVGILGVLKVGAAYVPQDVRVAPEAQLRHIIDVTRSQVILTTSDSASRVPVPAGHTLLAIDELMADAPAAAGVFQPQRAVGRNDRCFVLFTSGTTGHPNGVQVTHGNLTNILLTEPGDLGMRPGLRVAQILSISFDMAAWEILGALSHGSTLVIRGDDIAETVQRVDVVIATPSVLGSVDASLCRNVKVAAVAGEPCPHPLAETWGSFCTFYNSCGPTETTIINTAQHYDPAIGRLTIGTPTPNNTVYVLDEHRRPCVIGEVGEMWAGGDCVTAGYLANPELTAERYASDPFLGEGRMMFRTRDLGRWTEDGELEHHGRTDDQVKIRGFRVELDSVSAALESVPGATHGVTLKYDDRTLVGFVSPGDIDVDAARRQVAASLPYYCTPSLVIAVDDMPMTSRGKVDKRSLMAMASKAIKASVEVDEAVPA